MSNDKDTSCNIIVTHTVPIVGWRPSCLHGDDGENSKWKETQLHQRCHQSQSTDISDVLMKSLWAHFSPQFVGSNNDVLKGCVSKYFNSESQPANVRFFGVGGGITTFHCALSTRSVDDIFEEVKKIRKDWHGSAKTFLESNDLKKVYEECISCPNDANETTDGEGSSQINEFNILLDTSDSSDPVDADYTTVFVFLKEKPIEELNEAIEAILRPAARLLGEKTNVAWPHVKASMSPKSPNDPQGFGYDNRVRIFAGRRGAAVVVDISSEAQKGNGVPNEVVGSFLNLVEIMWHRLFMLVWLGRELDETLNTISEKKEKKLEDLLEVQQRLLNVRRTYFGLLQDPSCYLFDGGSVTDVADWYLDKFWIKRQESLIKDKLDMLDQVLASEQVVEALTPQRPKNKKTK